MIKPNRINAARIVGAMIRYHRATQSYSEEMSVVKRWSFSESCTGFLKERRWKMAFFGISVSLLACCSALTAEPVTAADATFSVLPAENAATTLTLSDDGSHLLVAHEEANRISLWDVQTGKRVKTLPCPSPRHILCVAGHVFVANYGEGTVSVYSQKTWEMTDQLLAGHQDVYYLSAPQGRNFKGVLIATCGTYTKHEVRAINLAKDVNKLLFKEVYMSVATVDYAGNSIIVQGETTHSPSAVPTSYEYNSVLQGKRQSIGRGDHAGTPLLYQNDASSFWFGSYFRGNPEGIIYSGNPPKVLSRNMGRFVIPDKKGNVSYAVDEDTITAIKLDMTLTKLGQQAISLPDDLKKMPQGGKNYVAPHPQAVHEGKDVYVFLLGNMKIYRGVLSGLLGGARLAQSSTGSTTSSSTEPAGADTEMPSRIVEGQAFRTPLFGAVVSGEFQVITGSKNASITPKGVLTWTPTGADIGIHNFKIKGNVNGTMSFKRFTIEVVSAALVKRVNGDISKLDILGKHYLLEDIASLEYTHDHTAILLQCGRNLRVLDADGALPLATKDFDTPYKKILSRKEYLVGLSANTIDLIDRSTLNVRRRFQLPGSGANDLVLHPKLQLCYVAITDNEGGKRDRITAKQILRLNERTGKADALPRIYGQWLAINPDGTMLYTAIQDMYQSGYRIDWNIGDIMPSYGNVDILCSYSLTGPQVVHRHTNVKPGSNGRCIRMAPDGGSISYVAGGGYRSGAPALSGYTIPAFDAHDIRNAFMAYNVGAYPLDVSYHPSLNLVAGTGGKDVKVFNRVTGETIGNAFDIGDEKISNVTRVFFTPGGNHLMLAYQRQDGRRVVHAFPLSISAGERTRIGRPRRSSPSSTVLVSAEPVMTERVVTKADTVNKPPLASLQPITRRHSKTVTTQAISKYYSPAVVVIKIDGGGGSGFFLTEDGYILTCAHVVPRFGAMTVSYRRPLNDGFVQTETSAAIVAVDEKADLALLKIDTERAKARHIRMEAAGLLANGEDVCAIGNPGLGERVLDYTITKGIVSNKARKIGEQEYIQTTATINPGSSGCPLFNAKGNVIGLVVLKGNIEGTGFAVPAARIYEFLKNNSTK